MNADTLERLLTDKALGGLGDDVDALLDAYLEMNPSAAEKAAQTREIVSGAAEMLRLKQARPLPPLPVERMLRAGKTGAWIRPAMRIAVLAACLLIGLLGGWGIGFKTATNPAVEQATAPATDYTGIASAAPRENRASDESGFWSYRRLAERSRVSRPVDTVKIVWTSPVEAPRIGG
jgi:hypothetical protein